MSVFDYKDSTEFSEYEYRLVKMFIAEFCHDIEFDFLDDINVDDVKMFWYTDRNNDVLGGFYYLQGNRIYLNRTVGNTCNLSTWNGKMNRVALVFPTIMHEMCHYWQSRHFSLLYLFLQLPVIREFTIERQAYAIQDILYDRSELVGGSPLQYAKMKKRHGFEDCYFDDFELELLKSSEESDPVIES